MHHRPKIFLILSSVLLLIAVSFPLQIMSLYNYSAAEISLIANKISLINILVITALLLNIPLLLNASPQLKYSLPVTTLLVAWNNFIVGSYGHDFSMNSTSLSTLAFALMLMPLTKNKYRYLLNNPQKRWWLRPTRLQKSLKTQIQPYVGHRMVLQSFDISETGIYIPFSDGQERNLSIGDMATLNISTSQFSNMKCEAELVRISHQSGNYPSGMGFRFVNLNSQAKEHLKYFISSPPH